MAYRTASGHLRLTMYVSPIEAGMIELLVHIGRYRTRSHVLRAALGRFLRDLQRTLDTSIERHGFEVGIVHVSAERIGKNERIRVLGTAVIDDGVQHEPLVHLEEVRVYGMTIASAPTCRHLGDLLVRKARVQPTDWDD